MKDIKSVAIITEELNMLQKLFDQQLQVVNQIGTYAKKNLQKLQTASKEMDMATVDQTSDEYLKLRRELKAHTDCEATMNKLDKRLEGYKRQADEIKQSLLLIRESVTSPSYPHN